MMLHSGGWLFYAAAAVAYLAYLARPARWLGRLATATLGLGFAGHSICFVAQGFGSGIPFSSRALVLSVFAWAMAGVYLASLVKYRLTVVGAFVAPVAAVLAVLAEALTGGPAEESALPRWFLFVHIATIMLGYGALAVSFCVAIAYLVQERLLKAKRVGGLFRRLPPLDSLDRLNQVAIVVGFGMLSVGLFTGAVWATVNPRPDQPLWTDPAVITAAIGWGWYAFAVQSRLFAGWRGRKYAFFSIIGFALVIASFVGIQIASEMHGLS